ncbi:MAG: DNA repair protein RecO [Actinomycetia bacterium]|nr:DNA repair protein RecO [Actinomycetes bacterium]
MGRERDRAVVLRHRPYRERDALVTLFAERLGKVAAVAKGVRTPKSRMAAGLQALTLARVDLYVGRSALLTVTGAEPETVFPRVREDLERMGRAAMCADLVDELTSEHDPLPGTFQVLVGALEALDGGRRPAEVFVAAAWHLLREAGLKPDPSRCAACGRMLDAQAAWRSGTGPVCHRCRTAGDRPARPASLAWLRHVDGEQPAAWGSRPAPPGAAAEVERWVRDFVVAHVGRVPRAFRVYDQVAWPEVEEGKD